MSYYQQVQLSDALKAVDAAHARAERLAAENLRLIDANDAVQARAERLEAALRRISKLNPETDSDEGWNEWGEAHCFKQAQDIASHALLDSLAPPGAQPPKGLT